MKSVLMCVVLCLAVITTPAYSQQQKGDVELQFQGYYFTTVGQEFSFGSGNLAGKIGPYLTDNLQVGIGPTLSITTTTTTTFTFAVTVGDRVPKPYPLSLFEDCSGTVVTDVAGTPSWQAADGSACVSRHAGVRDRACSRDDSYENKRPPHGWILSPCRELLQLRDGNGRSGE